MSSLRGIVSLQVRRARIKILIPRRLDITQTAKTINETRDSQFLLNDREITFIQHEIPLDV